MKRFFKYPWLIVGIIGAITVFFAFQLPRAVLDNNTFRFVPDDDPERVALRTLEEQYGSQVSIMVGLKRKYGSVFDPEFLLKLKEFSAAAAEIPHVESVTSLMNMDYISGDADTISVEPLVPEAFSGTRAEISTLKERLADWDLFKDAIISRDGRSTLVLVNISKLDDGSGDADSVRIYKDVKALTAASGFPYTEIYVTGLPAFTSVINQSMRTDIVVLIPLVAIVVLSTLFLSFRRIGGVVLPMLTVLVSTVWALGLMVFLGVKLSMLATVLPVILVAVGSAYGIHIISHYYDEMASRGGVTRERHAEIVFHALSRVSSPTLLAALTTLAGFVSLAFTSVVPIREFGIFASVGVFVAYITAIFLIPSLLIIRGPAPAKASKVSGDSADAGAADPDSDAHLESDLLSRGIANAFGAATCHPLPSAIAVVILGITAVWGIGRIVIDNVIIEYFKDDTDIVKSDRFIRSDFAGSGTLSIVVRGKEKGDLTDPEILKAMDDLSLYLETEVPEVGKVMGFPQMIKRINQVFNSEEPPEGLASAGYGTAGTASADEGESFGEWGAFEAESPASGSEDFGFGDWGAFEADSAISNTSAGGALGESVSGGNGGVSEAKALTRLQAAALLSRALADTTVKNPTAGDLVKAVERATNYHGAAYYEIPTDPARYGKADAESLKRLIGNYLVLLSGDISQWADDPLEPKEARLAVQLRTVGQKDTYKAVAAIRDYIDARFPEGYETEIAGAALVENSLNNQVVNSQVISIISSLLLVFLILTAYYRSLVAGLLGIFTLGLAVAVNFTIMGIAGIKLNLGTALVGSICVGTGIDYIIHYLAAYKHETLTCQDQGRVLRRTFLTSGKAIIFNAVSVGAGFAVLTLSKFNMLAYLGALVAAAMLVSSVISLTVLPVLLNWLKPAFTRKQ